MMIVSYGRDKRLELAVQMAFIGRYSDEFVSLKLQKDGDDWIAILITK